MVKTAAFGTVAGVPVTAYTIANRNGVRLTCLDYGATWMKLEVPAEDGLRNLLLASPDISGYTGGTNQGKTIGRVAGRIGAGQYSVALPANEGSTTLHGGPHGFGTLMWQAHPEAERLCFTRHVTSAEDGFPGNIDVTVGYTLTATDDVVITYEATSDAPTLFNPTNHAYWNLNAGDETVTNHRLTLLSQQRFALGADMLPTGELLANAHSVYDFTRPTLLQTALAKRPAGYDDIFLVAPHAPSQPVARLSQGRVAVTMSSSRNALVVFSANQFDATLDFGAKTSRPYIGIAIEAQTAPSAVADPRFGDISLRPGQPRQETIRYHFDY